MKKFLKIFLFLALFTNIFLVNAEEKQVEIKKQISITDNFVKELNKEKNFTIEESFIFFSKFFEEKTPESYKYISLNFKWVEKNSDFEKSLKILVYNNKIPNLSGNFNSIEKNIIKNEIFYKMASKILWIYYNEETIKNLSEDVWYYDLEIVEESSKIQKNIEKFEKDFKLNSWIKNIFDDVYETIINEYYKNENLDKEKILKSAIEWMVKWLDDKHTVYFPPTESKDFLGSLNWDFEWIWTYVEMPEPWVFKISTPIPWWPAEKAWIRGWDIVLEVDSKKITKENSQTEIISWIKWPAWTEVNLKIDRNWQILDIKVIREKVHIKSVESYFDGNNYVIKIVWFNSWVADELEKSLETLKEKKNIKKIVFDLRDNWGWFLEEAVRILSFFIKKWEPVVKVEYTDTEGNYLSKWYNLIDLEDYEIVFVQNSWTASASEIMIWTIKDYFPKTKIVWEKSYWKGSVQSIKEYNDGSSFKYTTAKWYTWKWVWIDWVWIEPTHKLELNESLYRNSKIDNQLQKALSI